MQCNLEKKRKRSQYKNNLLDYFIKNKDNLQLLTIDELKSYLKYNKLPVSGKKCILIERINKHILDHISAIKIQKTFRRHYVKYYLKLLNEVNYDAVNDSDSITLEPIKNIWKCRLISLNDNNNFNYIFDIISLVGIYKNNKKINPYNRILMTNEQIHFMMIFSKLFYLIFSYNLDSDEINTINELQLPRFIFEYNKYFSHLEFNINKNNENNEKIYINEVNNNVLSLINQKTIITNLLINIRNKNTDQRIIHLFMEIDNLGSYTNSKWFSDLYLDQFIIYYKYLYSLWNLSVTIPRETKNNICICGNPFDGVRELLDNSLLITVDRETAIETCLFVMENLLYGSLNIEYRKLGMMYILIGLTNVSIHAREAMPWLYGIAMI
jgi:hypothetical protein